MTSAASTRFSVALLIICILSLDALLIGLARGQTSALALSGLDGGFCSLTGHDGAGATADVKHTGGKLSATHCAWCSSISGPPIASLYFGRQSLPHIAPVERITVAVDHDDRWPSANPRASPKLS
jgi:hypothetical protein